MSESQAIATELEEVVPGIWAWSVTDERIGDFVGSSFAVETDQGTVLVDPHRVEGFERLLPLQAIVLTTSGHQRSSWRLRREHGTPVWAPEGVQELDEQPDHHYGEGTELPGGLRAVFTPGAGTRQHTLLLDRDGGVAFVPDLLVMPPGGNLGLIPDEYAHDPAQARETTRKLLDLPFDVLCLGHGGHVGGDAKARIREEALSE